jgi:hypothetical protein
MKSPLQLSGNDASHPSTILPLHLGPTRARDADCLAQARERAPRVMCPASDNAVTKRGFAICKSLNLSAVGNRCRRLGLQLLLPVHRVYLNMHVNDIELSMPTCKHYPSSSDTEGSLTVALRLSA